MSKVPAYFYIIPSLILLAGVTKYLGYYSEPFGWFTKAIAAGAVFLIGEYLIRKPFEARKINIEKKDNKLAGKVEKLKIKVSEKKKVITNG